VKRRRFVLAAAAVAAAPLVRAQPSDKTRTLGILSIGPAWTSEQIARSPLGEKLKSLGWEHGRNLRFEPAYAGSKLERLPELAAGLVQKSVDAIWAISPPAATSLASPPSPIRRSWRSRANACASWCPV
jgi:ABC-type uncharacterized transport system substrate-binding protein